MITHPSQDEREKEETSRESGTKQNQQSGASRRGPSTNETPTAKRPIRQI